MEIYWRGPPVIAIVATGDEGDGIRKGDTLLIDVETRKVVFVIVRQD